MRFRFAALLIAACLLPPFTAAAQNTMCGPQKAASAMSVDLAAQNVTINHVMSRDKLRHFNVDTKSPYTNERNIHVNGLMRGTIDLKTNIAIAWQRDRDEGFNCLWYQKIDVTMALDPIIYIAREIPQGSCLYAEVLKHEMKHLEADLKVMSDYQIVLQDRIDWFLKHAQVEGPHHADVLTKARKNMGAKFDQLIKEVHDQLQADRIQRQSAIDTLGEYERVAKTCPGDIGVM